MRERRLANATYRETFNDLILSKIYWYVPRSTKYIYNAILEDYGSVNERLIQRHLARLCREGWLRFVEPELDPIEGCEQGGYLRTDKKTPAELELRMLENGQL